MDGRDFIKMHGLGNDFIVLDARAAPLSLDAVTARRLADRRTGVGCDQLIIIEPSARADAFMRIRNADGEEVAACGNGTRCVAALLFPESAGRPVTIETSAGLLRASPAADGQVTVDMGVPGLEWRQIPLAREADTLHLALDPAPQARADLEQPVAVSIGNPHCVFFVEDAEAVDAAALGRSLEHHPMFPERANIGFAQVLGPAALRVRVWERGVGLTRACGTGACAAAVAAIRRGLAGERRLAVRLDGGELQIEWRESDGHVLMTGPAATSFTGTLPAALLAPAAADAA